LLLLSYRVRNFFVTSGSRLILRKCRALARHDIYGNFMTCCRDDRSTARRSIMIVQGYRAGLFSARLIVDR
jgi:hypothetical protein